MLILQGPADTTVSPDFTNQLTQELRAKGDALSYRTYPGVSHVTVLANGASAAASFFAARLR